MGKEMKLILLRSSILMSMIFACLISLPPATGQEPTEGKRMIDHLVYAAPDLRAASDSIAKQLGVVPTSGGKHPNRGTMNALLALGGRQYLEIIAPDPTLDDLPRTGAKISALDAPEIVTFATENSDLETIEAKAKKLGLRTSGIRPGSRRTPGGDLLQWRSMMVVSETYGGLLPFFIDWQETTHPGASSAQGARLARIVVTHPEPDGLRALYDAFGIDVPVVYGNRPAIIAEIEAGGKTVALQGSGRGL
jgi:hypothetical protein